MIMPQDPIDSIPDSKRTHVVGILQVQGGMLPFLDSVKGEFR